MALTTILIAAPGTAQPVQPSSPADPPSPRQDGANEQPPDAAGRDLPVSIDKIKEALAQTPAPALRGLDEIPMFKIEIHERQKVSLEDLVKSLDFKTGPTPGGGLYGSEQQRQVWNPVDNPMRQPYAAFNQGELLTILVENLVGKYLAGRAVNAITSAERARAEAAAREEVNQAVREYCAAQPNGGAGIQICDKPVQ